MVKNNFYKGILFTCIASIFWGLPQPLFFNELGHVNFIEVVLHRGFWSFLFLFLILLSISKIIDFVNIFKSPKKIFVLSITASLIASNWGGFIYAVSEERVQDATLVSGRSWMTNNHVNLLNTAFSPFIMAVFLYLI